MTEKHARTFAELLDYLFREVHPKGRGSYTYAEVSQGIRDTSGVAVSASAIQQLRTGTNTNPKMQTIRALAGFFGVPPGYFFDEEVAERITAELSLLASMRDNHVRDVALRASGLSTETLETIKGFIERARTLEGLTDDEASSR
ncbi:Secondary metabolite protein [Streptomyces europaeiscabiei]|uniref:Secondary metabolite protein n=1 Tax=Streptomyces europaeiscabiei TaxID=146819 RepID=UPI0029BEDD23|nr:Secondary metabolite protein [Streptomyces europaeiscabiei]MDX2525189.1 Secondary metabolite protein [Streptomyces europaeiscabiei]